VNKFSGDATQPHDKRGNALEETKKTNPNKNMMKIIFSALIDRRWGVVPRISLFLLFAMFVPSTHTFAQKPRLIEIEATSKNLFKVKGQNDNTITVKPNEVLRFKVKSEYGDEKDPEWPGCAHSFSLKGYEEQGWNVCLPPGTTEFVLVAPSDPGKYKIECLAKCGKGHDDMFMMMIVK
jgi:heme/copper-type cytochrome/quinol oxidase subunit 2